MRAGDLTIEAVVDPHLAASATVVARPRRGWSRGR